jgi:hypothetical protein
VDDDTTVYGCYHPDVFVQPGTNHYLVTAAVPRSVGGFITQCDYLYRSTDMGQTFQPGVQLDTFNAYAFGHVVADRDYIICDYFVTVRNAYRALIVEARTFYTQHDTWGAPSSVISLDSLHRPYYSGEVAISSDGRVHTALMVRETTAYCHGIYYTSSSDHGVSWSDIELVNDDVPSYNRWYPDIGADSSGHAYVVWEDFDGDRGTIWFSTNAPAAIAEQPTEPRATRPFATVVRGVLALGRNGDSPSEREDARYSPHFPVMSCTALLDISGRKIMDLQPGANDVWALAPGVYFVRGKPQATSPKPQAVRKIVVAR